METKYNPELEYKDFIFKAPKRRLIHAKRFAEKIKKWGEAMDELYITYNEGHGQMNIHMNFFFPCSQERFKKLLKIIELDWQHKEELHEKLKVHFQKRIAELVELRKENGKKYFDFKQKAADTQRMIESRKHPNGVRLTKEELKQAREDLKEYKATYKKAYADANSNLKFKERFEKHLETLKSV